MCKCDSTQAKYAICEGCSNVFIPRSHQQIDHTRLREHPYLFWQCHNTHAHSFLYFFFVLLILFVVLRKATLSGKQRPARLRVLPVIIIIVKLRELLILNNHDKAIRRKLGQPHLNQCITAIPNNNYYYWRIEGGGDILIQVRLLNSAPFSSLLYPRHPRTNHRVAVSHSPRPFLPVFTNDPNQT